MSAQNINGLHPWGNPDETEFTAMERAKSPILSAAELANTLDRFPQWDIQIRNTDLIFVRRLTDVHYKRYTNHGLDLSLYPQLFDPEQFDPELERIFGGTGGGSREASFFCATVPCSQMAITQRDALAIEEAESYLISSGIVPGTTQPTLTVVDQTT